jgi:hypothetical protein
MIVPSQFKKLTKKDISKISDDNLKNILTIFSSKTNEDDIGYLFKSSFSLRQRVYIRSKVLHDFSSRNENQNITIDLIAKTINSTINEKDLESLGKLDDIKKLLKKYLSNYQNRTTVVYGTLSILGEVATMYVCSENLPKEMDFYDFLDQIYFLKWQSNRNLNHFNVYTDIGLSTEKISYMSAIYDNAKYNTGYYEWLYSAYYSAKKIIEKCGNDGKSYEYHHESSDFVNFIKNHFKQDKNRCFTMMENYQKSIGKKFFSESNKLSTADIYLVKKNQRQNIEKAINQKVKIVNDTKILNPRHYLELITQLYRAKIMFPVSLKQVKVSNPPFSILNYNSVYLRENKEDDDWFLTEVRFLMQLSKNKTEFEKYLNDLISIESLTPNNYKLSLTTQYFNFTYKIEKPDKSIKHLNYFIELLPGAGSVLIKPGRQGGPSETTSQTGEGQVTLNVFNEMSNHPSYRSSFSRAYQDLIKNRISIINEIDDKNAQAKTILRKSKLLSKDDFTKIIESLKNKTNRSLFLVKYADYLIEKEIPPTLTQSIKNKYKLIKPRKGGDVISERSIVQFINLLLNIEFLYFLSANQSNIKELVKKKIVMSLHSAASGRGYLLLSSSRMARGKAYLDNIQSAVTLKVGK